MGVDLNAVEAHPPERRQPIVPCDLQYLHEHGFKLGLNRRRKVASVSWSVGIKRVSRLLRHADVSITARVYTHLRPSDLAAAAAVLDADRYEVSRSTFTLAPNAIPEKKKPLVSG
jgi:integrase